MRCLMNQKAPVDRSGHEMPGKVHVTASLLYIVDDDQAVGRTVARAARDIGFQTRIYNSATDFVAALDELDYGCVVLDIKMPGMSGLDLIKVLRERRAEWPVIMLTGYGEVGSAVESFRSGAVHFLSKPFKRLELMEALAEAVAIGKSRQRAALDPEHVQALRKLTNREREVLGALSEGMQSKTIAWQLGISIRTVDLHRSNILAKLSARNTSQAVAIAKACDFGRED